MKRMKRVTGILLSCAMMLSLTANVFAAQDNAVPTTKVLLEGNTSWTYWDKNVDPAGNEQDSNYDRTVWTKENFDAKDWKTANGTFGSKKGSVNYGTGRTADTLLDGCDGSNNTPAYFFRTKFNVSDLEKYTKLEGSIEYDDGAIVYINGQRVAAGHDVACNEYGNELGHGFNKNMQYGGSNAGPDTLDISLVDLSILHNGENTIAVEIHNGRINSSDVWFSFGGLKLTAEEVEYQNNVSLNIGADETKINFNWYSPIQKASVFVSETADMKNAVEFAGKSSLANDGQYSCKAEATNLKAETTYYYQLSNAGNRSEVYSFKTDGEGDFSFAFVGDPQIGASGNATNDGINWGKTLNQIENNSIFSDVAFLVSAGDQVNTASDEKQYDAFLEHDFMPSLPIATAIGNHDSSSAAYGQHFNLPNESKQYGVTAAGGDYYFVYNNTLFFVINSNAQSEQDVANHKAFMKDAIEATKNENIQWKVAVFHHTLFTVASHAHDSYIDNENGFKTRIIPVFDELDIDVALMGHDHVYCRTYIMDGKNPVTEFEGYEYGNGADNAPTSVKNPEGVLYVTGNSGSGSKTYGILKEEFPFSAVSNQENKANISKVVITDDSFTITTYRTADMSVIDTFTINKVTDKAEDKKEDEVPSTDKTDDKKEDEAPSTDKIDDTKPADKTEDEAVLGETFANGNNQNTNQTIGQKTAAKTGDMSNVIAVAILFVMCGGYIAVCIAQSRKEYE